MSGTPDMSSRLSGKVLVLGGAQQHCKLVEAAHNLGVATVVVDYLNDSPAKRISDASYCIDVNDIDSIVKICQAERVDGIVSGWLDPCQLPYYQICKRGNYRCYGNELSFSVMTDKEKFKRYCNMYNVGTIPYVCGTQEEIIHHLEAQPIEFPLFIKPVDSRGSRGQAICDSLNQLREALDSASAESTNGRVIAEKYMGFADDISVTYFFVDGRPVLERFSDRLLGAEEDGLSNVCVGTISPSRYLSRYINEAEPDVIRMLSALGIENGPVFMQGFVDKNGFYFYDPGLRFPGGDYERAVKRIFGIDFAEELVKFSLGLPYSNIPADLASFNHKVEIIHDVSVRPGKIEKIDGIQSIESIDGVVSLSCRYGIGDSVGTDTTVVRRFAEINFTSDDYRTALNTSKQIQNQFIVEDLEGDMKISSFADRFDVWYQQYKLDEEN